MIGFAELGFSRRPLYNIYKPTQARLRCIAARSGSKLDKTSLTTDGGRAPAFVLYILHNYILEIDGFAIDYGVIDYRNERNDKINEKTSLYVGYIISDFVSMHAYHGVWKKYVK